MKSLIYLSIFLAAVLAANTALAEQFALEGRITNGTIARQGQFPYQVGLDLHIGTLDAFCGGTILSKHWILTAAHCAFGVNGVTVYFGAFDIKNYTEVGQIRMYCSKRNIFVHQSYNSTSVKNDIALIKLPVPIEFNNFIQPAMLPKKSGNYSSYEGELAIASGWGRESDKATTISQHLRYIEVPIMKQSTCKRYIPFLNENMICIKTTHKKSACNGDSGGPLVYRDNGDNYVIGATSFGTVFGCEKGIPAVYTRLTSYLDWIEQISGVVNK